ncbi:MAG TPA: hypothetical protein VFF39_05690, partial [Verrucomicrobiae bacterium]|nr:hypothetical protein [Verrucomicrobiae bacterium]
MTTAAGGQLHLEKLCPACLAWLCVAEDAYCGGCGHLCVHLVLELLPPVLPVGRPLLPKVAIRFTNTACVSLRLKRISTPEWLELEAMGETEIGPGDSRVFLARASTASVLEAQSYVVCAQTTLGDPSVLAMVIPEPPVLLTSPALIEYWPDEELSIRNYEIDFYPPAGHLRILHLREPVAGWLILKSTINGPALVSKNAPLKVRFQFDPRRLAGGQPGNAGSRLTPQVGVSFESAHGEEQIQVPMLFEIRKPPALLWIGEQAAPPVVSQTAGQVLTFVFANSTDGDPYAGRLNGVIELKSAVLCLPAGYESAGVQLRSLLPLKLVGGQSRSIEFHANLQSLEPGIQNLELRVETTAFDRIYRVPVEVRALEKFGGAVAIDFGTSNTCCALLTDGGDFENVPLDEQRTTAPTLVRYLDLSGQEPLTETGSEVKHRAAVEEKVAGSTLARLKQCLGESTYPLKVRPANSSQWTMREARDAATDYLRHIRMVVEKRKVALFDDFILTHPAVCSLRQYRNLRWALENAFGRNARIHFLQEPIAALVPFFREIGQNGVRPSYTVAAFDLGGGTTDITVVRVAQAVKSSGAREIRPEILASWGERFGGEDLTDFLVKEVEARCQDLLAVQRAGYRLADEGVSGASTASIRRNEAAFREWAEEFKAG